MRLFSGLLGGLMKIMCLPFWQFAYQTLFLAAGFLRKSWVFVSALSSWMCVACDICSYPRSVQLTKEWEEKMPKIQTEQDMQMAMLYTCF